MSLAQDTCVVIITEAKEKERGNAAIREGADDYFIKGQIDGRKLRRILCNAVGRRKMLRELRAEIARRARCGKTQRRE